MLDELNTAIETYWTKWQALVAARRDRVFFEALKPTAAALKTKDLDEFNVRVTELRPLCEQVHLAWIDERWLGTFYLREPLASGISVVKLMQRRPNSTDAIGLDHLDFLLPENSDAKDILAQETDLNWTQEKSGEHCKWLSVWFDNTEAKLRRHTVLQVCADELLNYQRKLTENL